MKVCVYGLWHLGTVTAACLSEAGFETVALDDSAAVVRDLRQAKPPLFEPGIEEMLSRNRDGGRLSFETDPVKALADCDVLWVALDTPVDEDDHADTSVVRDGVIRLFPHLRDGVAVLMSSQMPVGTTASLEAEYRTAHPGVDVKFAYSPENLRLGRAIQCFMHPDRIVVGVRDENTKTVLHPLLSRLSDNILYVGVESAEMTKHALNAFLATSITFINEVATVCEKVGADAGEVERALKSDIRIGERAYLHPGGAFAGGTLARDVTFLGKIGEGHGLSLALLNSILRSNSDHRKWWMRQLQSRLGSLEGRVVAVLGLTYKPGTDTLRRSMSVELCRWIAANKGRVRAYDPAVKSLPDDLTGEIDLLEDMEAALQGSDALIIATEWPEFKELSANTVRQAMAVPLVIDQNRFIESLSGESGISYVTIGKAP